MHHACGKAKHTLDGAIADFDDLSSNLFGEYIAFCSGSFGCIKMGQAFLLEQLRFLTRVPYLFCRLGEAGGERPWAAVLEQLHHLVSNTILGANNYIEPSHRGDDIGRL